MQQEVKPPGLIRVPAHPQLLPASRQPVARQQRPQRPIVCFPQIPVGQVPPQFTKASQVHDDVSVIVMPRSRADPRRPPARDKPGHVQASEQLRDLRRDERIPAAVQRLKLLLFKCVKYPCKGAPHGGSLPLPPAARELYLLGLGTVQWIFGFTPT